MALTDTWEIQASPASPDDWDLVVEATFKAAEAVSDRWHGSLSASWIAARVLDEFHEDESRVTSYSLAHRMDPSGTYGSMVRRASILAEVLDHEARQEGVYGQYTYQEIDVWTLLEKGYLLPIGEQGAQPRSHRDYRNPDSVSLADKADLNKCFELLDSTSRAEIEKQYRYPRKHRINKDRLSFAVRSLTRLMNGEAI